MYCLHVDDFDHWRELARELLKREISPNHIAWQNNSQSSLLFGEERDFLSLEIKHETPTISRDFMSMAKNVACYRDEEKWSLLYSIAWRIMFEDRNVLDYKIDDQVARFHAMRRSIGRDKHKMEAFVRFRKLTSPLDNHLDANVVNSGEKNNESTSDINLVDDEYFVAWFEPEHLIVPLTTPFFVKRFNNMRWSILTPDICVHWDLHEATFTEGLPRGPAIEDDLENLWLEYYANIFNPARLKLKAMQSEMPKKYWSNLPEAPLIAELTRKAAYRTDHMIEEQTTAVWNKTAKSSYVKEKQEELRKKRSNNAK